MLGLFMVHGKEHGKENGNYDLRFRGLRHCWRTYLLSAGNEGMENNGNYYDGDI